MNSLSWMIYLGTTVPLVANCIGSIAFLTICVLGMGWLVTRDSYNEREEWSKFMKGKRWIVWVASFLFLLVMLVPSKQTIYLIAASQMGETALNSPIGQEVQTNILNYLHNLNEEGE
jgi:hypothetical protein